MINDSMILGKRVHLSLTWNKSSIFYVVSIVKINLFSVFGSACSYLLKAKTLDILLAVKSKYMMFTHSPKQPTSNKPARSIIRNKESIVMHCAIRHHLYNLKNVRNTHGGVLIYIFKIYVFQIVQMVPNRAKYLNNLSEK